MGNHMSPIKDFCAGVGTMVLIMVALWLLCLVAM